MVEWDGTIVLETPRLLLRTYRLDDLPTFAALNADPEVVRFLGGEPLSRAGSDEIASWAQQTYANQGVGLLAVERRDDGAFLGMCGLHHWQAMPDDVEVAWRLAHEHWGHGYATEAATAWLNYGFESLGLTRIISVAEEENVRSMAVMRRLGMVFDHEEAELEADGTTFAALVHSMTMENWRSRTQSA